MCRLHPFASGGGGSVEVGEGPQWAEGKQPVVVSVPVVMAVVTVLQMGGLGATAVYFWLLWRLQAGPGVPTWPGGDRLLVMSSSD